MIDFDDWIFSCNIEFINGHLRYWDEHMLTICFIEGRCYSCSDEYEKIVDLVLAVCFSYIMNIEILFLRVLDSPDFKFFVVENKPKDK